MTLIGPIASAAVLLAGIAVWLWPERCLGCGRRIRPLRLGDGLRHDLVCRHCGASQYIGDRSDYWRGGQTGG